MIRPRFFLQFNSLMFSADRGRQRVALGLTVASLVMAPSMSALPFTTLWAAIVLLLPRRAT
ncbi:MAG TPA: hypothetical protein VII30_10395 [Gemmatimonadaceae bacterium]